jgi:methylamine utilization protein MauE
MPGLILRLGLGAFLIASAALKLASPERTRLGLATFGLAGAAAWAAWTGLIAAELGLAVAVIAGSDDAAWASAAMMLILAGVLTSALIQGRAGAPCGCFGGGSKVSRAAVLRNLVATGGFVAVTLLPEPKMTTDEWLGLGLGVALLAVAGLAIAVLALAREIGMLRLRLGPSSALEIPSEGPELGARIAPIERLRPGPDSELAMAVFVSEGCHVCQGLKPSIESLAREPAFAVAVFDERADAELWSALAIPGSPYAVVTDLDGVVLAKGTFNNLGQLESVLATAQRRRLMGYPSEAPVG